MKYILEIFYEGECIEQRELKGMMNRPLPGEQMHIEFQNPSYSDEHGNWWIIRKVKHLVFSEDLGINTIQLFCEPDPTRGE